MPTAHWIWMLESESNLAPRKLLEAIPWDIEWLFRASPLFEGADALQYLMRRYGASVGFSGSPELGRTPWRPIPVVGRYFEHIVHAGLSSLKGLRNIHRNIMVREGGRTLGEIDFLMTFDDGLMIQVECCYKCYLSYPDSSSPGKWTFIGPDPRDSLERKRRRMMTVQLPLRSPRHPSCDLALPLARGVLFYHPTHPASIGLPVGAHPEHERGTWVRVSELDSLDSPSLCWQWALHPKPYWLHYPATLGDDGAWMTFENAACHIRSLMQQGNPFCLASRRPVATDLPCHRMERVMVVGDQWPMLQAS